MSLAAREPKLSVLFLTRYTARGASSRYRVYQYLDYLQDEFDCTVRPLFPERYLTQTYKPGSRTQHLLGLVPLISASLARRWWLLNSTASKYDVVFIQYEVLPYLPLVAEQTLFRFNPRVVVDFDDAMHEQYAQLRNPLLRRLLRSKIPGVAARSRHVIVANRVLADWASQLTPNVTIIPTSIDLRKYTARDGARQMVHEKPVIGWIGTPVTARYLKLVEAPLRALRERHDFVLKVIGAPDFQMEGVDVVAVPWQEATEIEELRGCDIGIMPLPDDRFARGKSALKLIQYLAAGVPAVVSPVGANCDVVTEGKNGFFAASDDEWIKKLASIIEQPAVREQFIVDGRGTVEEQFSLASNAPRLSKILRQVARSE